VAFRDRVGVLALLRCALACAGLPPTPSAVRSLPLSLLLLVGPAAAGAQERQPVAPVGPLFDERAAELGLDFEHSNGMSGELYPVEVIGAGVALLDYDGDGDLDVYLRQGRMLERGRDLTAATSASALGRLPLGDRLYRNDVVREPDGSVVARFVDVTRSAGIGAVDYAMGVATGDVDGDGWVDLYLTNFGPNRLWRNRGDGTFEDWTARAGVDDSRWSVPAVFFDADGDGDADLYVGNYVRYSIATNVLCRNNAGVPIYCGPLSFRPETDRLFLNRGDGTFEDASSISGIGSQAGNTLGAVAVDVDGDGKMDLYVANDQMPNFLWLARGDGTFEEGALLAGCAVNAAGRAEASMGVDAVDVDGDGDFDLFLTHLTFETNTLYLNDGSGLFTDATLTSGLGTPSFPFTGFGAGWLDVDGDGQLDLAVVHGDVRQIEALVARGDPHPLHQPNQFFRNLGGGRFAEATVEAGPGFALSEVSRSAAVGDIDGDGDADLVVTNNNGPVRLLVNRVGRNLPWLGLRLLDARGADAVGATVEVVPPDAAARLRRVHTDGSYLSARDPRVLVGLGAGADRATVRVRWPNGRKLVLEDAPAGSYLVLRQRPRIGGE
jgi:enediyne biosynthesis protein E4